MHCSTARDLLGQETLTCWCTQYSHKAKTQPDRYSPMETRAKLLGPPRYTASFFPSIIALQFYLNCHSCSWHCKTTQAGEGKGNPIPTYRKVHSKHGGAITSPHRSYSRGKSNTDNKAGMARIESILKASPWLQGRHHLCHLTVYNPSGSL